MIYWYINYTLEHCASKGCISRTRLRWWSNQINYVLQQPKNAFILNSNMFIFSSWNVHSISQSPNFSKSNPNHRPIVGRRISWMKRYFWRIVKGDAQATHRWLKGFPCLATQNYDKGWTLVKVDKVSDILLLFQRRWIHFEIKSQSLPHPSLSLTTSFTTKLSPFSTPPMAEYLTN